jgi:hypothetical protein
VAPAYNPRYSGNRDQEYHGSKSYQANNLQDPISKHPTPKIVGGIAQVVECLPVSVRTWVQTPVTAKNQQNKTKQTPRL